MTKTNIIRAALAATSITAIGLSLKNHFKYNQFAKAISKIAGDVDLTVPDDILKAVDSGVISAGEYAHAMKDYLTCYRVEEV